MPLRFLTSGESHGECLNAIIEGIGANFELDFDFINSELKARQGGLGRGGRMKIETDTIHFNSGVRFSKTTGAPICIQIKNRDWQNWLIPMSVEKLDINSLSTEQKELINSKKIERVRPGHADFAGAIKYNQDDIRNILERSSARETAARVAVGAICQNILKNFNITLESEVVSIGGEYDNMHFEERISEAQKNGESLGGKIKITIKNLPIGLGSHTQWDRRLDGRLAQAVMSTPAVKSVEIGLGAKCADETGSKVHDEIFTDENNKIYRKTNNAGGLEGGMTNGENIEIYAAMKPIPTMKKALNSINLKTKEETTAHFERADTCAVDACGVVIRNMCAIVILDALFEKFGCDNCEEIKKNFLNNATII